MPGDASAERQKRRYFAVDDGYRSEVVGSAFLVNKNGRARKVLENPHASDQTRTRRC